MSDVVKWFAPDAIVPWTRVAEEDDRYKKILKRTLIALLLLFIVFPWLPLQEESREEAEKVPARIAKVILEKKKEPPKSKPKQQKVQEVKRLKSDKKPLDKKTKQARKKASSVGVAAFSKQLNSLRSSLDVAKLQAKNTTVAAGASKKTVRSLLGKTSAKDTSGGIQTAAISRNAGGTDLKGHKTTGVSSPIGDGLGASVAQSRRSKKLSGRDMESIRRVFEQHKGAIYSMYTRALRKDPGLEGKFVFDLVIETDGSISSLKLVSSELGDAALERKILARIRRIDFGPADGKPTPVNYKFDFFPS